MLPVAPTVIDLSRRPNAPNPANRGVRCHVVPMAYDDGHSEYLCQDPDSFLVIRERQVLALHPHIDPSERRFRALSRLRS